MPIEFKPEEVEKLKNLLSHHPEGDKTISALSDMMALQDLANNLKFPLHSFADLEKQLGPKKKIAMRDEEVELAVLKRKIPAYYFPIDTSEDFFDKAAELMKLPSGLMKVQTEASDSGMQIPIEEAPPISDAVLAFKGPSSMPDGGGIGYKREQIEQAFTRKGGDR